MLLEVKIGIVQGYQLFSMFENHHNKTLELKKKVLC